MELLFFVLYSALLLLLLRACTLNETNYRPKKYGKTVENIEVKVGMEKTQEQTHIFIFIYVCKCIYIRRKWKLLKSARICPICYNVVTLSLKLNCVGKTMCVCTICVCSSRRLISEYFMLIIFLFLINSISYLLMIVHSLVNFIIEWIKGSSDLHKSQSKVVLIRLF